MLVAFQTHEQARRMAVHGNSKEKRLSSFGTTYLSRLDKEDRIIIGQTDGTRVFDRNIKVPKGIKLHRKQCEVFVYEQKENAAFIDMVDEVAGKSRTYESLCLTQHQMLEFSETYNKCLCRFGLTFFLLETDNDTGIAVVCFGINTDENITQQSRCLWHPKIWHAEYRHRFVFPVKA